MTENNELRIPRESISLDVETAGTPKISKTNWSPKSGQDTLRLKQELEEQARREKAMMEFETLPHTKMIRDLEKQIATLQKQVKALTSKK